MGLKAKVYVINHKTIAEGKLAARLEMLKAKGIDDVAVKRDSLVKKYQAAIRKAKRQLAAIANQEKQNAELAQAKADKLAAKKNPPEAKAAPAKAEPEAKPKKEKKTKEKKPKAAPAE